MREVRPDGLGIPGNTRVLYEPFNDDQRVDALNQLDLRLEKALRFGGRASKGRCSATSSTPSTAMRRNSVLDRRFTSANFGVPLAVRVRRAA